MPVLTLQNAVNTDLSAPNDSQKGQCTDLINILLHKRTDGLFSIARHGQGNVQGERLAQQGSDSRKRVDLQNYTADGNYANLQVQLGDFSYACLLVQVETDFKAGQVRHAFQASLHTRRNATLSGDGNHKLTTPANLGVLWQ